MVYGAEQERYAQSQVQCVELLQQLTYPELSLQSCLDIHAGGLVIKLFVDFVIRLFVIWFWCFRV